MSRYSRLPSWLVIVVSILVGVILLSFIGKLSGGFENFDVAEWNLRERNPDNFLSGEFEDYNQGDGITATADKYGRIALNGTLMSADKTSVSIPVETVTLPAGTYTISGCASSNYSYRLVAAYKASESSTTTLYAYAGLDSATFTLNNSCAVSVYIEVFADVDINNVRIDPVLVIGQDVGDFFA